MAEREPGVSNWNVPNREHGAVDRTTCLVAVWDDGIYRTRCSMGTKGRCAKHGPHKPHPDDGRPCNPNPHDDYCHTHAVYMDPRITSPTEHEHEWAERGGGPGDRWQACWTCGRTRDIPPGCVVRHSRI